VTIGIRGTDFWGRSRAERQVVCLIEGAIEVGAPGEAPVAMNRPRQFYQRDKGKTQPVGLVEARQLEQWSLETELEAGKGALRRGGRFSLSLLATGDELQAHSVRDRLREAGYAAETTPRKDGNRPIFVVRVRQLPSREEAQALGERLRGRFGVRDARVMQ
jgi:hypothetical protein